MAGIEIRYNTEETDALLAELRRRMGSLQPVMDAVGQIIQAGTQQRFVDQKGPDGTPWEGLRQVTIDRRRTGTGTGTIQILRDTGRLMNSIDYKATDKQVSVFSNVIYSATHQFGAKKGEYGTDRRGNPIPWGKIPARPFFGYNPEDQQAIVEVLRGYLQADQTLSWWERLVARVKGWFR
jgi:phage virion morphogenesis protein